MKGHYGSDDVRKMDADFKLQESGNIYTLGIIRYMTEHKVSDINYGLRKNHLMN